MNFILPVNKPEGISSFSFIDRIKRKLKARKIGHCGTLDPMASGLMLVCFNEATKISQYLLNMEKEYIGTIKLGEATDTFDKEGKITKKCEVDTGILEKIDGVVKNYNGKLLQRPPIFSAVKYKGKPAYRYARKGVEIPISPKEVTIYSLEILSVNSPYIEFKARCSKGTYIRTLANDIGSSLGCGGHLAVLKRTAIGKFSLSCSAEIDFNQNETSVMKEIEQKAVCVKDALDFPEIEVDDSISRKILNGIIEGINSNGYNNCIVKLVNCGRIFALAEIKNGNISLKRVFNFNLTSEVKNDITAGEKNKGHFQLQDS